MRRERGGVDDDDDDGEETSVHGRGWPPRQYGVNVACSPKEQRQRDATAEKGFTRTGGEGSHGQAVKRATTRGFRFCV